METRQIFIDTETTGLSVRQGHRIVEIAALEATGGRLTGRKFHAYLNPERNIDQGAQQVHGLTTSFLRGHPKFSEIAQEFISFVRGAECLMHNAPFDVSFIDAELERAGHRIQLADISDRITCTLKLARKHYPGESASLDALMQRAGLNFTRQNHSAMGDTRLLSEVYFRLLKGLSAESGLVDSMPTNRGRIPARAPMATTSPMFSRKDGSSSSDFEVRPSLIPLAAKFAERYITILRAHPTKTYNYATRGYFDFPVFEIEQHGQKCRQGESWLYFAIPEDASPYTLKAQERLYVGAQTQDRMFRGDGMGGTNFHHAEMRAGCGNDTPLSFLKEGKRIVIYRADAESIAAQIRKDDSFAQLRVLELQPRTPKKHLGWWLEQYVLFSEPSQWRWNTASADKALTQLFA